MSARRKMAIVAIAFGASSGLQADDHIGRTLQYQRVAPSIYFEYPTITHGESSQTYRLDWCYEWGIKCGADSAEAFCAAMGYRSASDFAPDPDIGVRSPTIVMKDQAICDQEFCDGFEFIACSR